MGESKTVVTNRKARYDYEILSKLEAGLVLTGTEVKSLRAARVTMSDAYAQVEGDEVWLKNLHINPYEPANRFNHDPLRKRKLLLHRQEIRRLRQSTEEKGYTVVPLSIFFNERGIAKVVLGVARGKRAHDRRDTIKERDARREIARAMKERG